MMSSSTTAALSGADMLERPSAKAGSAYFTIGTREFAIDGEPIRLLSGAMHYFRIVAPYWRDRLQKLKACGLNTVETYVPWNWHEPVQGQFRFDGMHDLSGFISLAAELGLYVIVRPSPYICAEWDLGGLPAWLLRDPAMRIRCSHPAYLNAIARYYDRLMPLLAPLQCTAGGPIIAMQIENEYGSFGSDKNYLAFLEKAMRDRGIDVPLFTSDGPEHGMLQGGTLPHIFKTVNFGDNAAHGFEQLREYQADGPLMCMEFWNGWFDHWGEQHHVRSADNAATSLSQLLATGASVNFYMFHGGTNFGYGSGANFDGKYQPTVTSYDYDAPLDESGDVTAKFHAFQTVISHYTDRKIFTAPPSIPKRAYGEIIVTQQAILSEQLLKLSYPVCRVNPEPMEALGQASGFILYRTYVSGPRFNEPLAIQDLHDRAQIFINGVQKAVLYRNDPVEDVLKIDIPAEGAQLDILVENMGRINYGPRMVERKGITEGVRLSGQFLHGWEIFCLPLDDLSPLEYAEVTDSGQPAFYRAIFEIDEPADTFVSLSRWTKGLCFVNGFNLGRYWNISPHRNLYLPGPILSAGRNEIVLFELHGVKGEPRIDLVDHADVRTGL